MLISKLSLLDTVEVDVPMAAILESVADNSTVENVAPFDRTPFKPNQSIVMIPPTFLENTILELQNMEGGLMILEVK